MPAETKKTIDLRIIAIREMDKVRKLNEANRILALSLQAAEKDARKFWPAKLKRTKQPATA